MSESKDDAGVEHANAIRALANTFPLRWLERSLPPSLLGGPERREGLVRSMIAEDEVRGIGGRRRRVWGTQALARLRQKRVRAAPLISRRPPHQAPLPLLVRWRLPVGKPGRRATSRSTGPGPGVGRFATVWSMLVDPVATKSIAQISLGHGVFGVGDGGVVANSTR
jgi:hypothetical protein